MSTGPPGFFRDLWNLLFGWIPARRESDCFIDPKHTNLAALRCLLTNLGRDLDHIGPKPYTDDFQKCLSLFEDNVPTQPIPVLDRQQKEFVVSVLDRILRDFGRNAKRYLKLYKRKQLSCSNEPQYWDFRLKGLRYIIPQILADNLARSLRSNHLSMLLHPAGPYHSPPKPALPAEQPGGIFPPMTAMEAYDKLFYFVSIDFPGEPLLNSFALLISPGTLKDSIVPIAMRYNRALLDSSTNSLSDHSRMLDDMCLSLLFFTHFDANSIRTTAAEPWLVSLLHKRQANPVSLIGPSGGSSAADPAGSIGTVRACLLQYLPSIIHDVSTRQFLDPATYDLRTTILKHSDTFIAGLSRLKPGDIRPLMLTHLDCLIDIYAYEIKADPRYPNVWISTPLKHYRLLKYLHQRIATSGIDAPVTRDGLADFLLDSGLRP